MKLSRIYSNDTDRFVDINFNEGLNAVVAEIRLPENMDRDTHNLGKTTLGALLNFCMLSKRDRGSFLFKHHKLFSPFVFFLEIEGASGTFITVRRSVAEPSKASFKRHSTPQQDFRDLPEAAWDHWQLPFERARGLLDGFLDLTAVSPWDFRKGLGYQLRSQRDYDQVFQLNKYVNHADWKPYVAHVLGFDSGAIARMYSVEDDISTLRAKEALLVAEVGGSEVTAAKVEGLLLIKNNEIQKRSSVLDTYNFGEADIATTNHVVSAFDSQIADLNEQRYALTYTRRRLRTAIEDEAVAFDPSAVESLFAEMNVLFAGQLKRDFSQLVEFNKAISAERRGYLSEELAQVEGELTPLAFEIEQLNVQRAQALSYLGESDSFQRFRSLSDELIQLKAEAIALQRQADQLHGIAGLRSAIAEKAGELRELQALIESDLTSKSEATSTGTFTRIRLFFSDIIRQVLDKDALLTVYLNDAKHPEFKAEILDDLGDTTSADEGLSYRKLLCVAFDLAVLRAHINERFPRFVYHDGIFEGLDPRKKELLIGILREYSAAGIQQVITLLDSDAPPGLIHAEDVVLTLHDEGDAGRLFRMPSW